MGGGRPDLIVGREALSACNLLAQGIDMREAFDQVAQVLCVLHLSLSYLLITITAAPTPPTLSHAIPAVHPVRAFSKRIWVSGFCFVCFVLGSLPGLQAAIWRGEHWFSLLAVLVGFG